MGKSMKGAEDLTATEEAAENAAAQEEAEAAEHRLEELREEAKSLVLVEYVGEPPYGREFISSHTIHKSSATLGHKTEKLSFAGQGIEVPEDLVWSKTNNWMVQVPADQTDLIEGLRAQPFLKVRD